MKRDYRVSVKERISMQDMGFKNVEKLIQYVLKYCDVSKTKVGHANVHTLLEWVGAM